MNADLYIDVLQKGLLPFYAIIGKSKKETMLVEDNDKKHTSKKAVKWKKKQKIQVIPWPSNSPDLNPIENLWSVLKRRVANFHVKCMNELKDKILEEWKKIATDYDLRDSLIRSMPKRCSLVIKNKGKRIKY